MQTDRARRDHGPRPVEAPAGAARRPARGRGRVAGSSGEPRGRGVGPARLRRLPEQRRNRGLLGDLPAAPLKGAAGVAVSTDGKSVYVASPGSDSISHLFRDTAGGRLAWDGCLNNDGTENCGELPSALLEGAGAVAVSRTAGQSVYVTSGSSDGSIAHFCSRIPADEVSFLRRLPGQRRGRGLRDLPGAETIFHPQAVEVSPDGAGCTSRHTGARSRASPAT